MTQKHTYPVLGEPFGEIHSSPDFGLKAGQADIEKTADAASLTEAEQTVLSKKIVRAFLEEVRSGKKPDNARRYMADTVLAHQMNSENETTVKRTPQNYADHVREFLALYGNFSFEVTELLAEGNKVYARWKQTGKHLTDLEGYAATGQPLVEIASAVYRVEKGKIAEYWIQIDRLGGQEQLKRSATK